MGTTNWKFWTGVCVVLVAVAGLVAAGPDAPASATPADLAATRGTADCCNFDTFNCPTGPSAFTCAGTPCNNVGGNAVCPAGAGQVDSQAYMTCGCNAFWTSGFNSCTPPAPQQCATKFTCSGCTPQGTGFVCVKPAAGVNGGNANVANGVGSSTDCQKRS